MKMKEKTAIGPLRESARIRLIATSADFESGLGARRGHSAG